MEKTLSIKTNLFLSSLLFFSSSFLLFPSTHAITPPGTIERTTKQQVLATIPPNTEAPQTPGSSQPFITSPSGKYQGYLLRRETSPGAGGFGNDFCYIQIQSSGHSVWESECAAVSNENACTLVFSDAGLEIFDGSRSSWDTDADADDALETLVLIDRGDMQITDRSGNLAWKASDNPIANQECGSVGSPGLASGLPPFASPIAGGGLNFGQPLGGNTQQPGLVGNQQQKQPTLGGYQQQQQQQLPFNQPLSGLNTPFGVNSQPLVDNTPFDSRASPSTSREMLLLFTALAFVLVTLMAQEFLF
ncbi:uncharacterized protein LOC131226448 [Magnolia sinica]|uniref:uncharacterized protein LOC131226448 n=1 Tax=Magnolia sinica TaxID=86752 RepID=UPI00265AA8F7|nr:uncharacterized protein LOC131226448 [Magnolia sinica]